MQLSEQEIIRRQGLEELQKLGINPYPADLFEINASAKEILEKYPADNNAFKNVSFAGRIMNRRIMGNASFAELQDDREPDVCRVVGDAREFRGNPVNAGRPVHQDLVEDADDDVAEVGGSRESRVRGAGQAVSLSKTSCEARSGFRASKCCYPSTRRPLTSPARNSTIATTNSTWTNEPMV